MRPFETFIRQKLKEGWTVEDFARFFNVTRERAAWLIKRVHNENKIRGERRAHPAAETFERRSSYHEEV